MSGEDQSKLAGLETDEVKKELFRQYTKHNEEQEVEDGIVRCKLVLVGAEGVGKTSFMNRLTKNRFNQAQAATIGAQFFAQGVAIEEVEYQFQIWDVSGDKRYSSLIPMYLQLAQAAMIVYDITRPETFEQAKVSVDEIAEMGEKDVIIFLVGMKSDILDEANEELKEKFVKEQDAVDFANTKGIAVYPFCSAKNGEAVEDLILDLAETLHERRTEVGGSFSTMEPETEGGEKKDPYGFTHRAATTLKRKQRRRDTMIDDMNERFTGCLSCLNACFAQTYTNTQTFSRRAAEKTREAFQSMSQDLDKKTTNARKSLRFKANEWRKNKHKNVGRQASLIDPSVGRTLQEVEVPSTKKESSSEVTNVTVAPLKG